jgi:signal transduction histidine kinase
VGEIAEFKDHPVYVNLKLEAYLSAPIFVNEKLYGTLNFTSLIPRQHGFSEHEHDLISMMAVSIGNFILLQSKENTLKKTNLRIKELVGYLSHDLRGPLGSINGLCKVALTHTMTEEKKTQIFETIHQESEKSLELVNTILDQAALGTGKIDLHKEYFTAEDFIQNALETFSLLIKEKELNVKTSTPFALELFADRPRLLQAVNNLLVNAFKYAKKGSDINISFIEKGDYITCTISNLKDDKASTVNETIYKSVGYGLDIVHDILRLHGTELKLNEENDRYIVSFDLATASKNI